MHIEGTFAALCCEQELARHYESFRPLAGQFSVKSPYQQAQPVSDAKLADNSEHIAQPRKRRKVSYQPNKREREAEQRHDAVEADLLSAVAAFQRWLGSTGAKSLGQALNRQQTNSPRTAKTQCISQSTAMSSPGSVGFEAQQAGCLHSVETGTKEQLEDSRSFDLISLAELRTVVKPKFRFHSDCQPVDLFDRLIESSTEQTATAFETELLVPSRCAFMVCDMASFRLLVPGSNQAVLHPYQCA